MVERKKLRNFGINRKRSFRGAGAGVAKNPAARLGRRNFSDVCDAFALTESFVVTEDENLVLQDRAPARASKLVAAERRLPETTGILKEIRGVQRAIA